NGTCATLLADGADCRDPLDRCARVCYDGVCATPRELHENEDCTPASHGQCGPGLSCMEGVCRRPPVVARLPKGSPCTYSCPCAEFLWCRTARCAPVTAAICP